VVIRIYGVIIVLIVLGIPCALIGILLYHGLREDLRERRRRRVQRGFEVVQETKEEP
jgi:hypothetical protein